MVFVLLRKAIRYSVNLAWFCCYFQVVYTRLGWLRTRLSLPPVLESRLVFIWDMFFLPRSALLKPGWKSFSSQANYWRRAYFWRDWKWRTTRGILKDALSESFFRPREFLSFFAVPQGRSLQPQISSPYVCILEKAARPRPNWCRRF